MYQQQHLLHYTKDMRFFSLMAKLLAKWMQT
jgi:hypothetical protein